MFVSDCSSPQAELHSNGNVMTYFTWAAPGAHGEYEDLKIWPNISTS